MGRTFDSVIPDSLEHALELLACEDAVPMAGGTDVLVGIRNRTLHSGKLIQLCYLNELKELRISNGFIFIGAGITITEIVESKILRQKLPLLLSCAETIGSLQIRNRATIGGNAGNASPAADMVTSLYTFDAKIILQSRHDTRTVPVEDFFLAPGKTVIEKGELILGFEIDDRFGSYNQIYYKLGQRKALACAKVSLAMAAANTQNNVIRDVRIAFGAVAPTVIRAKNLEAYLNGRTYSSVRAEDIDKCLATDVAPIDDIRSTGEYRLKMCSVLVKRGLNEFMTKK